jgi:hypothetical protein
MFHSCVLIHNGTVTFGITIMRFQKCCQKCCDARKCLLHIAPYGTIARGFNITRNGKTRRRKLGYRLLLLLMSQ